MPNLQIEKALDSKTEFWGICCETGKRYSQIVGKKFHISMAALDPTDTSTSAVVSLMAERDGSQYLLCSLKKDSILQVPLNLYFEKGENITFFLKGHGTVHLSGYYVFDKADGVESSKNSKKASLNELAEKGGKANFTVSANVESSSEEETSSDESNKATVKNVSPIDAHRKRQRDRMLERMEEIAEHRKLNHKRDAIRNASKMPEVSPIDAHQKRQLDLMVERITANHIKGVIKNPSKMPKAIANEDDSSEDDSMEEDDGIIIDNSKQKQSTSPVKKPQDKKLPEKKSQEEDSSDEDLFGDEDLDDDDDEDEEEEEETQQPGMKREHSAVESSESDTPDESSSDDDDSSDNKNIKAGLNKIKKQLQEKKLKSGASTPVQHNKGGKKSTANDGKPDLNSSIGRTPMPKKRKSESNISPLERFIANMKEQSKSPKKDSSKSEEANTSASKTPEKSSNDLNTSAQSESAKKKKKKKANEASGNQNTPNKTPVKQQFSHKLAGGIEYEDIRPGNGLVAKKGKLVHVYYTGQLENNKVFDSVQQGQKPFSFKLASGQVIKGWDLGIEGMKVGGKRRLKIPPIMGYANKRTGPIPPNSTLYFTVELKAVS